MNLADIQAEIVSRFFSADLKKFIEEKDYVFTGVELLSLSDHFAPTYQEKLKYAKLLSETDDAVSGRAKAYIEEKSKNLSSFLTPAANEVYELTIQPTPDAYPERYLSSTFETAVQTIDDYYKTYSDMPDASLTFTVDKRKVRQPREEFSEDNLAYCILTSQKMIKDLYLSSDWKSDEMSLPLPEFPAFLPPVAPVKYIQNSGTAAYGIYIDLDRPPTETCLVIPFDSGFLKNQNFKADWPTCPHEHIPCPNVDTIPLSVLPFSMQESYYAFLSWWEEFHGEQ